MPAVNSSTLWSPPSLVAIVADAQAHGVKDSRSFSVSITATTPTVGNFSPPPGTQVGPGTPLSFDALDAKGFRQVTVTALAPNGSQENVFTGGVFVAPFASSSTVAPIAGGLHFSILRDGGWLNQPQLTVRAINQDGIEAS